MNGAGQERDGGAERDALAAFLQGRGERAFDALFSHLYPRLYRYFRSRGAGHDDAQELAQNVMLTVHRRCGDLRDPDRFFGWLYQVAHNELLQRIRSRGRAGAAWEPLEDRHANRAPGPAPPPTSGDLPGWLGPLEPGEQQVVLLRYVDELGYEEIAQALAIPLGTVKWRLFSAKSKLAASLAHYVRRRT